MSKSVAQLEVEVAKLQQRISVEKAKEAKGVISRIKEAIDYYGLTAEDLFNPVSREGTETRGGRSASEKSKSTTARKLPKLDAAVNPSATPTKPKQKTAGVKLPAKFADGNGNTWTGRGSTPRWLTDGVASGKSREDFAVQSKND
ncbi:H-NS histone family protein [Rhizobacter sp. LjRoot28]|uniref:H-NS histone family protein n=1 Tax=Rhizobacter sp. LjRoot28 TaxID=3342309 RepID=UPI003ED04A69